MARGSPVCTQRGEGRRKGWDRDKAKERALHGLADSTFLSSSAVYKGRWDRNWEFSADKMGM